MFRGQSSLATFIIFITLAMMPSHASAEWSRCGNESGFKGLTGTCQMSGPGHHLLRYGNSTSFFFIETDGNVTQVPCTNHVFGDSAYTQAKFCEYTDLAPVDTTITWTKCATEGGTCSITDGYPHLVKYTSNGNTEYRVASTDVACNNDYFIDVDPGATKECDLVTDRYGEIKAASPADTTELEFTDCASEYQPCNLPSDSDVALIRLGGNGKWVYRLASMPQFTCSIDVLQSDPSPGAYKFCQYAYVPPRITGITGSWTKLGSCENCDSLSATVTVGVQGSRSNSTSRTWAHEVSVEVEKKFGTVVGGKVGYKYSWGGSESTETTVSRSVATTKQAICSTDTKQRINMFQWSMEVSDECYALGGKCHDSVLSFDILCTDDDTPSDKLAPACQPGRPPSEDIADCVSLSPK